jgi:hypothetical protein
MESPWAIEGAISVEVRPVVRTEGRVITVVPIGVNAIGIGAIGIGAIAITPG